MKQQYQVTRTVYEVLGSQTHFVDAESYEEAARLVREGRGVFDDEQIEVLQLSDDCLVSLPDDRRPTRVDAFGKIRRPNPQDHPGPSGPRVHPVVGPTTINQEQ